MLKLLVPETERWILRRTGWLRLEIEMWVTNKYWYWGVVAIVLVANITSQGLLCYGCSSHERIALLQLKLHFPRLYSWGIDDDCCNWDGVLCNPITSRVSQLSIWGDSKSGDWYLNASLFLPFHELTSLELPFNYIAGCVESGGFETLSKLENLESLYLNDNSFNNSILSSLGGLSLKELDLRNNAIKGSINMTGLNALSYLEELDLSENEIIKFEPSRGIKGASNLSVLYLQCLVNNVTDELLESLGEFYNLRNLSLKANNLTGAMFCHPRYSLIDLSLDLCSLDENFFQSLELLPSLKVLSIQGLQTGLPTSQGFPHLKNLEQLDLNSYALNNKIVLSIGNLASLQYLNLTNCGLSGDIAKSFETLSKLENLESLDLSFNSFNNSILSSLGGLSLKRLDLNYNAMKGSINMIELNALSYLKELDLGGNEIIKFESSRGVKGASNLIVLYLEELVRNVTDELLESLGEFHNLKNLSLESNNLIGAMFRHPRYSLIELSLYNCSLDENFLQSLELLPSLKMLNIQGLQIGLPTSQGFPQLKNLEQLDLSNYALNNKIVLSIGNLSSLQYLNLADCGLSGHIPKSLCALKGLRELDMGNNYLIGNLPYCMENLTSLQQLDMSDNTLSGDIYFSPLKSLIFLKSLTLSNNYFQIPLSFSPFFNHSKLKSFYASENEVYSRREMHNLIPKFQLQSLSLLCCGNCESFPQFLYYQHDLQEVDISHVKMKERFPHWLLQNSTNLMSLDLKNTSLLGLLELPVQSHKNLESLVISDNRLFGQIPSKIGACFPGLVFLNMSSNNFSGSIPSSLGNMNGLDDLDLSNNGLSGKLPNLLIKGCQNLVILKLSNNKLQGQMFPGNVSLPSLMWLQLDGNQFTGSIPDSLSKSPDLVLLDVSHNNLYGEIPRWITNITKLDVLDLSHNKLDGILLPNLFPPSISQVYLSNNRLQGSMLNEFNCTKTKVIDLSQNNLTGGIPRWLGRCSNLGYLLLKGNNFERKIPKQLCKLNYLSLVDLSSNYLCGSIPSCLRISVNNISFNNDPGSYVGGGLERRSIVRSFPVDLTNFVPIPVDFTTKNKMYSYVGKILNYLSGFDISDNALEGVVPLEIGNFNTIQVLNLSHNNLVGPIPPTFSNLQKVESLDLSHNKLEGNIPSQLTQLYFLSVFSVAYNNLSGRTPDMVAQFATFENNSYEGNPFLCGSPLSRSCEPTLLSNNSSNGGEKEEDDFIDMNFFYISFGVSLVVMLLGIFAVLYINPYWRRAWFYFVGKIMNNCFYFVVDNVPMLSKYRFYQPFE